MVVIYYCDSECIYHALNAVFAPRFSKRLAFQNDLSNYFTEYVSTIIHDLPFVIQIYLIFTDYGVSQDAILLIPEPVEKRMLKYLHE